MIRRSCVGYASAAGVLLGLAGCSSDESNLKAELQGASAHLTARIAPLPVAAPYQAFAYEDAALRDPFTPTGVVLAASAAKGGVVPDMKRPKEPLEAFALEEIKMVGTMTRNGVVTAIVRVGPALYRVSVGDHLGANFGRVMQISLGSIAIEEIVQDGTNFWVKRASSLTLEDNEGKK